METGVWCGIDLERLHVVTVGGFGASFPHLRFSPGRGSISLCLSEFGKVPGEESDAALLEEDDLALALCHLVALTTLITAAPALGLRHVVSMEVGYDVVEETGRWEG